MPDRNPLTFIAPVFIPNQGCPHRCIFCNQEKVTAETGRSVGPERVRRVLETALGSQKFQACTRREIAFYGGTFTNLSLKKMTALLETAADYLGRDAFQAIRISTRPDALSKNRLILLKDFGVGTVELGAQSMDEEVLKLSGRGHTAEQTREAVSRLREYGFKVGIQLMPGLPGDTEEIFRKTCEVVIGLRPDMVRLYPALVIRGTEMETWYRQGRFNPLSLDQAVLLCRDSCIRFEKNGIPVIRIGLMSSPGLKDQVLAGPWHEAMGFLVRSAIYHQGIEACLFSWKGIASIRIRVAPRDIPLLRGYRNQGIESIQRLTGAEVLSVIGDEAVPRGEILVEQGRSAQAGFGCRTFSGRKNHE